MICLYYAILIVFGPICSALKIAKTMWFQRRAAVPILQFKVTWELERGKDAVENKTGEKIGLDYIRCSVCKSWARSIQRVQGMKSIIHVESCRYFLRLPKGLKYSARAGTLKKDLQVQFGGLKRFRIPLRNRRYWLIK